MIARNATVTRFVVKEVGSAPREEHRISSSLPTSASSKELSVDRGRMGSNKVSTRASECSPRRAADYLSRLCETGPPAVSQVRL